MKTIIVAGAGSNVGKTGVLRTLASLLPDTACVKLGHAAAVDPKKEECLLPSASSLNEITKALEREPLFLLIEGNSILKRMRPDLAIFVEGEVEDRRADAEELKGRSDLVCGGRVPCAKAFLLADRLGVERKIFGSILNALKIKVQSCQLGCF